MSERKKHAPKIDPTLRFYNGASKKHGPTSDEGPASICTWPWRSCPTLPTDAQWDLEFPNHRGGGGGELIVHEDRTHWDIRSVSCPHEQCPPMAWEFQVPLDVCWQCWTIFSHGGQSYHFPEFYFIPLYDAIEKGFTENITWFACMPFPIPYHRSTIQYYG